MSNRIVGVVLLAFLVFITMKGDLRGYLAVIGLVPGDDPAKPASIPDIQSSDNASEIKDIASLAAVAA